MNNLLTLSLAIFMAFGFSNQSLIAQKFTINFEAATEDGIPITQVDFGPAFSQTNGQVSVSLPAFQSYIFSPEKEGSMISCMTNADLTLLSNLIENGASGLSVYQLLAADINGDHQIDADDLALLHAVIEGTDELVNPWLFVHKQFIFANEANPFATNFPSNFNLNYGQPGEVYDLDFVGIHLGNIDKDYDCLVSGVHDVVRKKLDVFPNPSSDFIFINGNSEIKDDTEIILYNALGQIVKKESMGRDGEIDIQELANGRFYGHLEAGEFYYYFSFVKG